MATQDNPAGLLSKVAKFVRNPNTNWADLDKMESVQESEQGKQALKHMIERKRHNDSVRRREFDQLRKLRRSSQAYTAEMAQHPSAFRGSTGYSDLDERAVTLKKIDEIEAQMSRQWWKGRQPGAAGTEAGAPLQPAHRPSGKAKLGPDSRSGFASTQASDLMADMEDAPTQMGLATRTDFLNTEPPHVAPRAEVSRPFESSVSGVFSDSKMVSVDLGQSLSDPELEEAAIRFANSDDEGAKAVLMAALQTPNVAPEVADVWASALFDLYRSTGQHASFDQFSLEYAQRFGRSAPAWFSTPQILGVSATKPAPAAVAPKPAAGPKPWECPIELDVLAVQQLAKRVQPSDVPHVLNWHALQSISPQAAPLLAELFARWCGQPLKLCMDGDESLLLLLQACTPTGDASVPPEWWQLRLDALRLLRLPNDFELVALDFCVTYELSPPSWTLPRGERVSPESLRATAAQDTGWAPEATASVVTANKPVADMLDVPMSAPQTLGLHGEVLGDAQYLIDPMHAAVQAGGTTVVSCAQLIRVDFSAAGSLLNWVANVEATGGRIEFKDVPRLVAAFFNLIGINEHARVTPRNN